MARLSSLFFWNVVSLHDPGGACGKFRGDARAGEARAICGGQQSLGY